MVHLSSSIAAISFQLTLTLDDHDAQQKDFFTAMPPTTISSGDTIGLYFVPGAATTRVNIQWGEPSSDTSLAGNQSVPISVQQNNLALSLKLNSITLVDETTGMFRRAGNFHGFKHSCLIWERVPGT